MAEEEAPPKFSLVTSTDPLRLSLWQMKQEQSHTDFKIKVEQTEIAIHKNVIAAKSEYFERMLQHPDTVEVQQGFVRFNEMKPEAFLHIVEYIYTGKIEFEFDLTKDIIQTVDRLGIIDDILMEELSRYIINNMRAHDCLGWFTFAEHHHMVAVKEKADEIRLSALEDVCNTTEFMELDITELADLFVLRRKVQEGHATDCDAAIEAAARWAVHDADTRKEKFEELLQNIPMERCSLEVLDRLFNNYKSMLFFSPDLLQRFVSAILRIAIPRDVIVFAGTDKKAYNRRTFRINLNTGNCTEKHSTPCDLLGTAICASPQGAICAGGTPTGSKNNATRDCVSYQKDNDAWDPLTPLQDPVCGAGAVCVEDKKLLVLGGWGERKNKASVYDLSEGSWSTLEDMLQGVVLPIVGSVRKLVFVIFCTFSGNDDTRRGSEISLQCFDTETSTWSFKAPLPDSITDTYGSKAVAIAGQLYVIGGRERTCVRYNPEMNLWTILTPPLERHWHGAATVVRDKIVICGGWTNDDVGTQSIEEYDPSTDEWKMLPVKLPIPLWGHGIIPL